MAALPYIQLYVADYLADTMHLDAEEHGAYLLLIMNYWQTGKPVPKARLQKIARVSNDRWPSVERSLSEFFNEENDCWVHPRIERDLDAVHQTQIQRSAAGKASAEARKGKNPTERQRTVNGRSTVVENSFNENSTNKDTDTDTDTEKENTYTPSRFSALKFLMDAGADEKLSRDWLQVRKAKKLAPTETAMAGFLAEVNKTGLPINDVLKRCCLKSWGGFDATWMKNGKDESISAMTAELLAGAV